MGTTSTSKKSNAGKNVLVFFIVFIILEMLIIFGVSKVFKNKNVTPSAAGYSMYLTDKELVKEDDDGNITVSVPKNVLVIASNGMPTEEKKNMAVLCENVPNIGTGVFWLADVQSNAAGMDGVIYTISDGKSFYYVDSSCVVGVTTTYYQTAGTVLTFITNKFGMIICAVVPLFLLVLIEIIIAIVTHSPEEEEIEQSDVQEENHLELDDFLFGGTSEGEQIARHRQQAMENSDESDEDGEDEEEEAEDDEYDEVEAESDDRGEVFQNTADVIEEKEEIGNDTEIDQSYYEKASKLLDGNLEENSYQEEQKPIESEKKSVQKSLTKSDKLNKSSNVSLEDLMKLMEEEQNRLKESLK